MFEFIGAILILASLLLSYTAASGKGKLSLRLMEMENQLKEFKGQTSTGVYQLRNQVTNVENEITNLKNINQAQEPRILELEQVVVGGIWGLYLEVKDDLEKMKVRLHEAEEVLQKSGAVVSPTKLKITPAATDGLKRLFFPLPDQKTGQFRASLGKDTISSYSIYQFNLTPEGNTATFQLLDSPTVEAMVLNFPQSYLRHTSDTEGTPGINKKIEVVQPGEAERQENYWIITKKGVIRYV